MYFETVENVKIHGTKCKNQMNELQFALLTETGELVLLGEY